MSLTAYAFLFFSRSNSSCALLIHTRSLFCNPFPFPFRIPSLGKRGDASGMGTAIEERKKRCGKAFVSTFLTSFCFLFYILHFLSCIMSDVLFFMLHSALQWLHTVMDYSIGVGRFYMHTGKNNRCLIDCYHRACSRMIHQHGHWVWRGRPNEIRLTTHPVGLLLCSSVPSTIIE